LSILYAGYSKDASASHIIQWQAMVARRFRAPDMNELYWVPGGNPSLSAEQGLNANMLLSIGRIEGSIMWELQGRAFYNDITNWIQWQPSVEALWTPVNYKSVNSIGGELSFNVSVAKPQLRYSFSHNTSFTYATGINAGYDDRFIMTYTPAAISFSEIIVSAKKFTCTLAHKYTAKRFTEEQNLEVRALKAYQLFSAGVQLKLHTGRITVDTGISVDNILNTSYESVRAYAMPGRVLQVHIELTLNLKKVLIKH
jgi:vitamin B12 transporter